MFTDITDIAARKDEKALKTLENVFSQTSGIFSKCGLSKSGESVMDDVMLHIPGKAKFYDRENAIGHLFVQGDVRVGSDQNVYLDGDFYIGACNHGIADFAELGLNYSYNLAAKINKFDTYPEIRNFLTKIDLEGGKQITGYLDPVVMKLLKTNI